MTTGGAMAVREALSTTALHRELHIMVRRRVPSSEVDDVVQSVLCDALAATRAPEDPADIPRWLMAIARHKVADFHRRGWREQPMEVVEAKPLVDPVEERDLLRAVLDEAKKEPASHETMRWVLREAEGERLADIADEAALPADVVRQRVCRLRRHLRSRWLLAAAAVLASLLWVTRGAHHAVLEDLGLPTSTPRSNTVSSVPANPSATAAARVERRYRIVDLELPATLDSSLARLAEVESRLASIEWEGERFVLTTPTRTLEGRALLSQGEDGKIAGELLLEDGRRFPLRVEQAEGRAVIELTGAYAGTRIVLER
ncbi:MAG: hypothetical protein HOW73_36385 [Polyangiaceae bacterium]|nr:hypothetical protein [Polyangiaceae bacterium]